MLASDQYCGCAWDVVVAQVPYNDQAREDSKFKDSYPKDKPTFQQLETDLVSDVNKVKDLPENVRNALAGCRPPAPGPAQ